MTIRYPWPAYQAPLQCLLEDVRLDDQPIATHLVDSDHLRIRLDSTDDWQRFDCTVTLTSDEPIPAGATDVKPYILASSNRTFARLPFLLDRRTAQHAAGHVRIDRSAVAGGFTLQAHVGATIDDQPRSLGRSDPWTVVLDRREGPVPPGAPPFDIAWIDFSSPDAPPTVRGNPDAHAVMDLTGEPRLLLNLAVEGLQALLHNDHAKLERRRVRDILGSSIARHATTTLVRAAVSEITAYGDSAHAPSSPILRQTCEAVADRMPGIGSVEELYERLAYSGDSPAADADLWTSIDLAVAALTGNTGALSTAAKEVAHG